MIDDIEKYVLDNYTSPDFPQSYEEFLKENYQDIVPELILGDEQLTDITNKVIKGEEVDDSYLGTFKDYLGDTVYEPEVDFTNALAIQARYIDDNEYLEWLNDDKMAKVLAEFPTRKQFIDHLGPMIEDIAEKYGDDPNLDLLINNMTYKSHPLAFYEFSQSNDFSEKDGDFGFREWVRKGINSIKRLISKNRYENQLISSADASTDDDMKFTNKDLKYISKNGTMKQQELANDILDKKKQILKNKVVGGGTLAVGLLDGGVVEKVTKVPLKVVTALSPGALTQTSVRTVGPTHDPDAWLQGQVRNAWEMSEKESKTTSEKVISRLKKLVDSGDLKLEEIPDKKYSRSDSSTGEIPMGPAKDNPLVNAGLNSRPNEFSEDPIENELLNMESNVHKKLDKSNRMYSKIRSLLTSGDMANIDYQYGDWIPDKKLRKRAEKYDKKLQTDSYTKSVKKAIDKKYGKSDLLNTVTKLATPILLTRMNNPSNNKDNELEKLRLENENLKLRQQQRYNRDYSEDGDFAQTTSEIMNAVNENKVDITDPKDKKDIKNMIKNPESVTVEEGEKKSKEIRERALDSKDIVSTEPIKPINTSDNISTDITVKETSDEPNKSSENQDNTSTDVTTNNSEPKKPRTPRIKPTEENQLDEARRRVSNDEEAKKLGMHWNTDAKGNRTLVKDQPKTETSFVPRSREQAKTELKADGTWKSLNHAQRKAILAENERNNEIQVYRNARLKLNLSNPNPSNTSPSTTSNSGGGDSFSKLADTARSIFNDIRKDKKKIAFANGVKGVVKGVGNGIKTVGGWLFNNGNNTQSKPPLN